MITWLTVFLLFIVLVVGALAGFAGHRLAYLKGQKRTAQANQVVAELISQWRRNETVAGAFAMALAAERDPASLIGVENCYYTPPDFERVGWVPRDTPTPFVGFAPVPGPLVSGFVNSMQFRYARELDVPKPPHVIRVFFVGASTAFGVAATSNDTTIGGYLEKYLNDALLDQGVRCEVVTAAACAWASTHERILIENRLIELEPDVVISFSGHNDVFWAATGHNAFWFRGFQDDFFLALVNAALAVHSAEQFSNHNPGAEPPIGPSEATLRLMRNVAFSHHALATVGADYIFALQPVLEVSRKVRTPREQRVAEAVSQYPQSVQVGVFYRHFRPALQRLEQPGFQFVDATTAFDGCDDKIDLFIDRTHFGDRANDLIARHLCGRVLSLIKERLAKSKPH